MFKNGISWNTGKCKLGWFSLRQSQFITLYNFAQVLFTVSYYSSKQSVFNEESIHLYWKPIGTVVQELFLFQEHHVNSHIHIYFIVLDNFVVSTVIKIRVAQNDSYVLWHNQVYFTRLHELLFFNRCTWNTWKSEESRHGRLGKCIQRRPDKHTQETI